ncbi:outer membrane protein assembly factor BamD [Blattabacterium cuenoti]|uniref:outer membrane protein assembly factor BamD n=1 Tax=Blattabacterium cuenoti TaxID=1653831 RepID=UPI00163CE26B|nr:tetratricopeptide repeat protein [Blattabacterium cuenoti]
MLLESCFLFTGKKNVLTEGLNESKEEEDLFKSGKEYYNSSLSYNLDQEKTDIAINKLNQFIKNYPNSPKVKEVYDLLNNLFFKIERKNYCIADSYFLMGRYQASLIYFQNLIKNFPRSIFKEKVLYKICVSQYKLRRKKDFFNSYYEYLKHFKFHSNSKKLKILYKKLEKL